LLEEKTSTNPGKVPLANTGKMGRGSSGGKARERSRTGEGEGKKGRKHVKVKNPKGTPTIKNKREKPAAQKNPKAEENSTWIKVMGKGQ